MSVSVLGTWPCPLVSRRLRPQYRDGKLQACLAEPLGTKLPSPTPCGHVLFASCFGGAQTPRWCRTQWNPPGQLHPLDATLCPCGHALLSLGAQSRFPVPALPCPRRWEMRGHGQGWLWRTALLLLGEHPRASSCRRGQAHSSLPWLTPPRGLPQAGLGTVSGL